MYLSAIFTLLLVVTLANGGEPFDVDKSLNLLCKNTQSVQITKISEVEAIIEKLRYSPSAEECSKEVKNSILDLDSVIDDKDDVCSVKKVEQIRLYHSMYVQAKNNKGKTKSPLPQPLRDFFIGYSLKVSSICKKNMINNLITDTRKQLTAQDFESLDLWTRNEKGSIFNNLKGPADYDDLLLSSDLIRLTETQTSSSDEKIFIQAGSSKLLHEIQTTCHKRFRPFYEKLIIPVVELANIGYNYQGEELERELREMRTNREVAQWYEIVYLCQALDDTVLVESEEDKGRTEGLDRKLVKILTKEEAEMLKKTSPNGEDKSAMSGDDEDDDLAQIVYEAEGGNPIEDVVLNENDENLKRLIKSFDTNKSDLDRIRSKLFWKMGNFLKENLVNGNFKIIVSTLFKRKNNDNKQVDGESASPRTEVVRAFDEYVQQMTRSSDNPVAGLGDNAKHAHQNSVHLGPSGIAHRCAEKNIAPANFGQAFWKLTAVVVLVVVISTWIAGMTG